MRSRLRSLPLVVAVLATLLVGCTRPPELIGIDNPEVPAESVPDVSRHRIFITTTRAESGVAGQLFSAARAETIGLASVDVTVPPNHVTGSLERPTRLPPDPRTEFAVVDPVIYGTDAAFIAAVDRELMKRPPGQRRLLLFVHGYNNTASDSILRLAQFVEDTSFEGVPILFSWASAASITRYVYDLNSTLIARAKMKELSEIAARTRAESVDIFAHSMGTLLTMEGLVDAELTGRLDRRNRINTIMLASPDIDIDLFRTQLGILPQSVREKMFLLVSENDSALRFSRRIAGGVPRVGAADAAELEALGVTVIDLTEINDSSTGSHSKFAGSPEVVQLIGAGLNAAGGFGESNALPLESLLAGTPIRILRN